jgi:hypothetical protein
VALLVVLRLLLGAGCLSRQRKICSKGKQYILQQQTRETQTGLQDHRVTKTYTVQLADLRWQLRVKGMTLHYTRDHPMELT